MEIEKMQKTTTVMTMATMMETVKMMKNDWLVVLAAATVAIPDYERIVTCDRNDILKRSNPTTTVRRPPPVMAGTVKRIYSDLCSTHYVPMSDLPVPA